MARTAARCGREGVDAMSQKNVQDLQQMIERLEQRVAELERTVDSIYRQLNAQRIPIKLRDKG